MKKITLITLLLCASSYLFAQSDTSTVEQYCQVIATPRLLGNKVTIDIDFGEEKSFLKDTRLKTDEGRIKKFNTVIDALNYMGKEGWKFINAFPVSGGGTVIYHYAFRKEFSFASLQEIPKYYSSITGH